MIIKTFDYNKKVEIVAGFIEGDTFIKNVKPNHFMRKYNGYGISKEVIDQLVKLCVSNIKVMREDESTFTISLEDWVRHSVLKDEGHGLQYFFNMRVLNLITVR